MDNKTNKMLIDATHPEETRVVVLRNGRVEEFDFESAARAQLRGNIYLAKVTRVEPSLQAAFVEYGGNRHGFLAFSEIHPDYYQIPLADKQALLDEEARAEAEADAEADARAERRAGRNGRRDTESAHDHGEGPGDGQEAEQFAPATLSGSGADDAYGQPVAAEPLDFRHDDPVLIELPSPRADAQDRSPDVDCDMGGRAASLDEGANDFGTHDDRGAPSSGSDHIEEVTDNRDAPETISTESSAEADDDGIEDVQERPRRPRRRVYKIQEVIKRRQVILVQVVKEERGNKGAALTTYLSLAGRYTVLMPNTGRGGGISRKITNAVDRKRLKAIAQELDVPEGMGLIIRTAGAARTNQEIKRDYEYLLRLWESVRELTLNSTAPSLVYEEGNLIKRSIRDLYSKEIDEIVVAGDTAHAEALDFMRMLMPSHAKNVVKHAAPEALFARYQIERQLNAFFSPQVTLRSGGYIVINQTEALVAIDVNSGKSTREYSIEETALNTNLEASDEIARQLKLRDLAGLIVVDFIDMEEKRNNRAVERRLKDALRFDRARIQVGHISHFGLLEMSRQRMRTGMLEGSTSQCPHCVGTGMIRSTESVALAVLRGLEDHLNKDPRSSVSVLTTAGVALYILNSKRQFIADIEERFGVSVAVQASERMHGANYAIERSTAPVQARRQPLRTAVNMDWGFDGDDNEPPADVHEVEDFGHSDDGEEAPRRNEPRVSEGRHADDRQDEDGGRDEGRGDGGVRRKRRRRRRGRDRERDDRGREAGVYSDHRDQAGRGDQPDDLHEPRQYQDVDGRPASIHDGGRDIGDDDMRPVEGGRDAAHVPHGDDDDGREHIERGEGESEGGDGPRRRRRRRGRRGGRRGREGDRPVGERQTETWQVNNGAMEPTDGGAADNGADAPVGEPDAPAHVSQRERQPERLEAVETRHEAQPPRQPSLPIEPPFAVAPAPVPIVPARPTVEERPKLPVTELPAVPDDPARPVRKGWWQRRILGE